MKKTVRNDLSYATIWLVRRLFRALAQRADEYLQDSGLGASDRAVMEFLYPDRELTVPEIAARHDVSRQHVQVTVNRLLKIGLLRVKPNPRHKRSSLVSLNGAGRETFAAIRERESAIVDQLFRGVSDAELETTHHTLNMLFKRLS